MANDSNPPGPGVDAQGRPVIDPTANVFKLVEAETKRQDDLRIMDSQHAKYIAELRATFSTYIAELRASHAGELREAETQRLNAVRTVDVQAVQQAAAQAEIRATTLATAQQVLAETLRTTVSDTAVQGQATFTAALVPITEAIADLRRIQYEQQGSRAANVETKTDTSTRNTLVIGLIGVALVGFIYLNPQNKAPTVVQVPTTPTTQVAP